MANFTAADVKKLREVTGAGMSDCKKALVETDGDFDKAVEILRIKGAKDVGKRAERNALEGLIAVSGTTLVEVNAEKVADAAAAAKANTPEELAAVEVDGKPAGEAILELSAKIGEKMQLRRVATLEGDHVSVYLHQRAAGLPPAVGVLVAYKGDGADAEAAAHNAALQVAALKARYLTREDVPAEVVDKERAIAEEITRQEGKPEQAIPKIVEGRLNGFYKDVVLLEQPSVADNKKSVKQLMDAADATLTGFVRFEVGQN